MLSEAVEVFDEDPPIELTMADLLVDAIRGVGFPTIAIGVMAEREKMAYFVGNQHNEHWRWIDEKLRTLPEEKLQSLYHNLKVAQHGR
jgi:hypothetical protein